MKTPSAQASRVLAIGAVAAVAACHVAAAAFFASHDPYATQLLPPCPLLQLTGWQCPGCGGTRALYSLLHGDVAASASMNPLVLAVYAAAALITVSFAPQLRSRTRVANGLALAGLAVVVAGGLYSGVLRNLL